MDSKSKLKALQEQNDNIKQKLNTLQIAINDNDDEMNIKNKWMH